MRKDFERTAEQSDDTAGSSQAPAPRPIITLDVSLYESYLADSDLTGEQKREFLETLWSIIVGFVDLGFGIHPVQQALESGSREPAPESSEPDAALDAPFQKKENKNTPSLRGQIARSFAGKEEI